MKKQDKKCDQQCKNQKEKKQNAVTVQNSNILII